MKVSVEFKSKFPVKTTNKIHLVKGTEIKN